MVAKPSREVDDNFCPSRERDRSRERDDRDEGMFYFFCLSGLEELLFGTNRRLYC